MEKENTNEIHDSFKNNQDAHKEIDKETTNSDFSDDSANEESNDNNSNKPMRGEGDGKYEVKIVPIKQSSSWDCGLACVKMVLEAYNINYSDIDTVYSALDLNTSVWTIDLCYILKHYNISHIFRTCTIGVDKNYSNEPFYKDYYTDDSSRVQRLFDQAEGAGLRFEKRTVSMSEIVKHLKTHRPIIVLVNWPFTKSQKSSFSLCFRPFFRSSGKYQGHFLLLTGCSENGKKLIYLNPEKLSRKSVASSVLDNARKSFGTDQDIILITERLHNSFPKVFPGQGDR